jgi:hypothetical protein
MSHIYLQNAGACYKRAVYCMKLAAQKPPLWSQAGYDSLQVDSHLRDGDHWMEKWEANLPLESDIGPLTPTKTPGLFIANELPGKPIVLTGFSM